MGDIQAQVAVGDINGDGFVELVAADANGNVAAFNAKAEELWERHVASLVAQVCTLQDDCCILVLHPKQCTAHSKICASPAGCMTHRV